MPDAIADRPRRSSCRAARVFAVLRIGRGRYSLLFDAWLDRIRGAQVGLVSLESGGAGAPPCRWRFSRCRRWRSARRACSSHRHRPSRTMLKTSAISKSSCITPSPSCANGCPIYAKGSYPKTMGMLRQGNESTAHVTQMTQRGRPRRPLSPTAVLLSAPHAGDRAGRFGRRREIAARASLYDAIEWPGRPQTPVAFRAS